MELVIVVYCHNVEFVGPVFRTWQSDIGVKDFGQIKEIATIRIHGDDDGYIY